MNKTKIINGSFYFIQDQYFIDFPDPKLMQNKETIKGKEHGRPCFYSLLDNKTGIYWFIPISSQIDKYQKEYNKKLKKYSEVDTIVFGYVMGEKKAFLIQNMIPITMDYVKNEYINTVTKQPVKINDKLKDEINQKAKKVLSLQRNGKNLIFPDVLKIEHVLLAKFIQTEAQEQASATEENSEN